MDDDIALQFEFDAQLELQQEINPSDNNNDIGVDEDEANIVHNANINNNNNNTTNEYDRFKQRLGYLATYFNLLVAGPPLNEDTASAPNPFVNDLFDWI